MRYRVVIVNYHKATQVKALLHQLNRQSLTPESVALVDNSPVSELEALSGEAWNFSLCFSHFS